VPRLWLNRDLYNVSLPNFLPFLIKLLLPSKLKNNFESSHVLLTQYWAILVYYHCLDAENRRVVYLWEPGSALKLFWRRLMWKYFTDSVYACHLSPSVEAGRVHIRDWRDRKSSRADSQRKPIAPGALKTRPCWFHTHHPQGCPLQAQNCAFAHGPDDLRPSTRPLKKIKNYMFF